MKYKGPKLEVNQYFKTPDGSIGKIEAIRPDTLQEFIYFYTIVFFRLNNSNIDTSFFYRFYHNMLFHSLIKPLGFNFKTIQALYIDPNRDSLE